MSEMVLIVKVTSRSEAGRAIVDEISSRTNFNIADVKGVVWDVITAGWEMNHLDVDIGKGRIVPPREQAARNVVQMPGKVGTS